MHELRERADAANLGETDARAIHEHRACDTIRAANAELDRASHRVSLRIRGNHDACLHSAKWAKMSKCAFVPAHSSSGRSSVRQVRMTFSPATLKVSERHARWRFAAVVAVHGSQRDSLLADRPMNREATEDTTAKAV